ncbi:MAG: U32 family peptidase [Promethearchaeota archaeon]|nr:MAG: U32 family peptidase [Candidatus Lokiarchaeota archaeon]
MKKIELLAPAKNFKAIKAASNYVDSIYFGVQKFNMRQRAENINLKELEKIVSYCRAKEIKTYLTVNILLYSSELNSVRMLMKQAKDSGIDAIIVSDFAAISIAKKLSIPFHVSTQCNVSNSLSARFYESLGAERIILARELSLEKIREIKRNLNKTEIEVFIHGAMCTCISGKCYFSQSIAGTELKSANRGCCIQPCRRRWWIREDLDTDYIYEGVRIMNSRDLCTIAYIPQLIEADIDAFKIEGRMRHPHYVETVSKIYREAIDAYYDGKFTDKKVGKWVTELKKVYNRGFTPGFSFKKIGEGDHQHKSPTNLSHYRYIRLGLIDKYNKNENIALINLDNGYLSINDDIIITGQNTDTYIHQNANLIKYRGETVKKTPRGTKKNKIPIELKITEHLNGNGTEKLYVFTNKTYKTRSYSL